MNRYIMAPLDASYLAILASVEQTGKEFFSCATTWWQPDSRPALEDAPAGDKSESLPEVSVEQPVRRSVMRYGRRASGD